MKQPNPFCFECQKKLSTLQRMRFRYFCSQKHRTAWGQEFNVLGVVRLQEARVRLGMEASEERFASIPPIVAAHANSDAERRTAARVALDAPVRVTIMDGGNDVHSGRFVNASAKGMKITMGIELCLGTQVRVDCNEHSIVGEVRRCQNSEAGYMIGLEAVEWTDKSEPSRSATSFGDLYATSQAHAVVPA